MQHGITNSETNDRLLKRPEVLKRVPLSSSTLYEMMAAGQFPRPIKIGKQSVAWRESDIEKWIQSRVDLRNAKASTQDQKFFTCTVTSRGFPLISFEDRYGETCSLQISSLAEEACCWLGIDAPRVQLLVEGKGWQPVPLPKGALISGRMHLTQDQVRALLPHLQAFAESGEFAFDPISA